MKRRGWVVAYWVLFVAFLGTAALNMLHVRGGFLTNHTADLVVPAWLYDRDQSVLLATRYLRRALRCQGYPRLCRRTRDLLCRGHSHRAKTPVGRHGTA